LVILSRSLRNTLPPYAAPRNGQAYAPDEASPTQATAAKASPQGYNTGTASRNATTTPTLKRWLPDAGEFAGSVGLGVLGGVLLAPFWMRRGLRSNVRMELQDKIVEDLLDNTPPSKKKTTASSPSDDIPRENTIAAFLANPATLMIMIPSLAPQLTQPAVAVSMLLGVGYMGTNLLSGMQEVWVRYQESQIRANLVASLDNAFQTSIERKTGVDEQNRRYARTRIASLLRQAGVERPQDYLLPVWDVTEQPASDYVDQHTREQLKWQMRNRNLLQRQQELQRTATRRNRNFVLYPQNAQPVPPPRQANPVAERLQMNSPGHGPTQGPSQRPEKDESSSPKSPVPPVIQPSSPSLNPFSTLLSDEGQPNAFRPLPQLARQPVAPYRHLSRLALDGIGMALGLSVTSMMFYAAKAVHDEVSPRVERVGKLLKNVPQGQMPSEKTIRLIKTTLAPRDAEAVLLHFFSQKESLFMGGLFMAMGIMLKTTQFLTEGLREIEVTNLNAETERQYETYKLTELEPHFKAVSERAQLRHALNNLRHDLPLLKQHPDALHLRVQRILDNIGMAWSAPNYYPMAPMVQLVPARS
jgi:hypothetical protein